MGQWNGDEPNAAGDGAEGTAAEEERQELDQVLANARAELDRYVSVAADFVRERPMACLAGAVAVGYLVGKLASRR